MDDNYITLRTFFDPVEAEIVKGKLESEGVSVLLLDGHIHRADPLIMAATQGVRLQIRGTDRERAEAILGPTDEPPSGSEEEPEASASSTTEGDAWMRRAAAAAVIGTITFVLPLSLYAVWLVLSRQAELRSAKGTRMMWAAIVFALMSCFAWGVVLTAILNP